MENHEQPEELVSSFEDLDKFIVYCKFRVLVTALSPDYYII